MRPRPGLAIPFAISYGVGALLGVLAILAHSVVGLVLALVFSIAMIVLSYRVLRRMSRSN